jgi:hypothetical protein
MALEGAPPALVVFLGDDKAAHHLRRMGGEPAADAWIE